MVAVLLGGFFLVQRYVLLNLHPIVAAQVYRSAQPTRALLERLKRDDHLRTVLKLNPDTDSAPSRAEAGVARDLGLEEIHVPLAMSRLPTREQMLRILDAIEHAPRPMLIHCNAGADRTGLVGTLVAMRQGIPFAQARRQQLSPLYLHVGLLGEDVTEILDQFWLERTMAKKPAVSYADFAEYVRDDYHPTFYHARIAAGGVRSAGDRRAVTVTLTNASRYFWARGSDDRYELCAYRDQATSPDGAKKILARQSVPPLDPGQTINVDLSWKADGDDAPIRLDVLQVGKTWFAQRGDPAATVGAPAAPSAR